MTTLQALLADARRGRLEDREDRHAVEDNDDIDDEDDNKDGGGK